MSFKQWKFFLNGEFLCFTLLSNFGKKILCQTLRRRANLEKTDLMRATTYQFCIFDQLDTCFGVSIRRTNVIRPFEEFSWLTEERHMAFCFYTLLPTFKNVMKIFMNFFCFSFSFRDMKIHSTAVRFGDFTGHLVNACAISFASFSSKERLFSGTTILTSLTINVKIRHN